MAKSTPKKQAHRGGNFDDFLKDEGIFEEVQARALKRALAEQLDDAMQAGKLSKVAMAQRMATSRSQLDRVLDPANLSVQLDTLIRAANAVGKTVEIKLKRQFKPRELAA
jgi:antitoxin HicB